MDEHYQNWPDRALPALAGLTPRQAARDPEQREQLIALLKMMENGDGELRKRAEGRPWFDFSKIKAELHVEY